MLRGKRVIAVLDTAIFENKRILHFQILMDAKPGFAHVRERNVFVKLGSQSMGNCRILVDEISTINEARIILIEFNSLIC